MEDLQFQLGIDMNGDDSVDLFANPSAAPVAGKPLCVRLWLRLRSAERENGYVDTRPYAYADQSWPAPGDSYRRLTVQTTIRLRIARP